MDDDEFAARVGTLAAFRSAHGRWPQTSQTAGAAEWTLARWLHRSRERLRPGSARDTLFEDLCPGWRTSKP